MKTMLISADGQHLDSRGARIPHAMIVDHQLLLLDLTAVGAPLVDPTIKQVTWGPQADGGTIRDGGTIIRQDGSRQLFWERSLLEPYLRVYEAERTRLLGAA